MTIHWVRWFKERRPHRECLDKAKELEATGKYYKVRVGHSLRVNGKKLSKIFVLVKKEVE